MLRTARQSGIYLDGPYDKCQQRCKGVYNECMGFSWWAHPIITKTKPLPFDDLHYEIINYYNFCQVITEDNFC